MPPRLTTAEVLRRWKQSKKCECCSEQARSMVETGINLCNKCAHILDRLVVTRINNSKVPIAESWAEIVAAFVNGATELQKRFVESGAKLEFLRFQFNNAQSIASGPLKTDVVIVVEDRNDLSSTLLHAHKFILANNSTVFFKMFEIEMHEKEAGEVRIQDVSLPVMKAVLKYCYTAEINFTFEVTPDQVLEVAHKYCISLLQSVCEEELTRTIDEGNLKLAKKFEVKGLQIAASKYFKDHFDTVLSAVMDELM